MRNNADARSAFVLTNEEWDARLPLACGGSFHLRNGGDSAVWSFLGSPTTHSGAEEDPGVVDCPDCLRLMRAATDPVRYDFLRERGLVPELPLVNG